ncbi:hypothetical protein AAC387_Pa01g2789 [Persea americana]
MESVHVSGRCRPFQGRARDKDVTLETTVPSPCQLPHMCKVHNAPNLHEWDATNDTVAYLPRGPLSPSLSCGFHVALHLHLHLPAGPFLTNDPDRPVCGPPHAM